jgi:prepilin-type N-terminal cleavage/methylation domain-containing protein
MGDHGMTLVEVMVALLILTVVLSALASVLTASLRSLHANDNRVKANAVATQLLEELRGLEWDEAGFSEGDHGYRAAVDVDTGQPCSEPDADATDACEATVTFEDLGEPVPDDPRPRPLRDGGGGPGTETVERDGTEYEVRTDISWIDDPQAAGSRDYKRFRLAVTWRDFGQQRRLTHSTTRAPEPDEQSPAAFSLRSVDVYPDLGYIHGPDHSEAGELKAAVEFVDGTMEVDDTVDAVEIEVVTTDPVDDVTVSFINRQTDTVTAKLDEQDLDGDGEQNGTEWSLSSSLSSGWQYRNGDTTFVITATRSDTTDEASISEPVRYVYEHNDIVEMTVDGTTHPIDPDSTSPHATDTVCVEDDGTVAQAVDIGLATHGMTLDDRIDVAGPGFAAGLSLSAVESTFDGARFALTVEAGHAFPDPDDADHAVVDFTAVREFDDSQQTRSLALELLDPSEWGGTKCEP